MEKISGGNESNLLEEMKKESPFQEMMSISHLVGYSLNLSLFLSSSK